MVGFVRLNKTMTLKSLLDKRWVPHLIFYLAEPFYGSLSMNLVVYTLLNALMTEVDFLFSLHLLN